MSAAEHALSAAVDFLADAIERLGIGDVDAARDAIAEALQALGGTDARKAVAISAGLAHVALFDVVSLGAVELSGAESDAIGLVRHLCDEIVDGERWRSSVPGVELSSGSATTTGGRVMTGATDIPDELVPNCVTCRQYFEDRGAVLQAGIERGMSTWEMVARHMRAVHKEHKPNDDN